MAQPHYRDACSAPISEANGGRRQVIAGAIGTAGLLAGPLGWPRRARAADRIRLKVMSWEQFQPGEKEGWNQLFDKFNHSQSKYHVGWTGWPINQYVPNVVIQAHAGGIDADVLMATPDLAAETIRKFKLAVPLDGIVKELAITPSGGHEYLRMGGKLYGLSAIDVPFAQVYNTAVFARAGVEPATSPAEWVALTTKLTKRPDTFGIALTNTIADGPEWWFQLQNFCLPFDGVWAQGRKPMVTSAPVIQGLKLWKSLYEAGAPQGSSAAAILRLMADGRIGQTWGVTPTVVVLKATNPAIYPDLRSGPPPWPNRKALDRIHPLIALSSSKNLEGALAFIKFAMMPDIMADMMMTNLYVIPPYDLAAVSPKFKQFLADKPWVNGFLQVSQVSPIDVMGDFAYADDQFGRVVIQNLQRTLNSSMSVENAMALAQTQLEALATRL